MARPKGNGYPKYREIADALRADIERGKYAPGDKLPSETELLKANKCSRGTARAALAVLQAEWLTEARSGAGVYRRKFAPIKRNPAERLARGNWDVDLSTLDEDCPSHSEFLDLKPEEVPARIADDFGMAPGAGVWRRDLRTAVEGRVLHVATSYLPVDIVGESVDQLESADPWASFALLRDCGRAPVRVREELRTRTPLPDEREDLGVTASTPIVQIVQTAFDVDDQPVEITEIMLDSSSYFFEYEFPV